LGLSWLLAHLPRRATLALGDLGGWAFYRLSHHRRSIAQDNIRKAKESGALPSELDEGETAKKSFENLGRTALESFCLLHRGIGYFRERLDFEGAEKIPPVLEAARESKRGLIFLTAHTGNWELSPAALADRFGFGISVVGRFQGQIADPILKKLRSTGGGQFISKDGGAMDMLATLRSGGILGTLFDQAAMVGSGVGKLSLLGRPALTTLGPLRLSAKTGSTVVTLFCRRQGDRHIIEFADPISPPRLAAGGKRSDWVLENAQKLNDLLADFIRRYPDQWMWSHRRWKMPDTREEELPFDDKPGRNGNA
jgi:KDO2-lipid IV(A) lauroyltransferase